VVQIDIPAAFVASQLFLDLGRKTVLRGAAGDTLEGRSRPAVYYRFLARSLFFAGFVICPAGIYLLSGWPGWEQIYWSSSFEQVKHAGWFNATLPALFVMAIVAAGYLGHVVGYRWLISGRGKYLRPTYIGVLLATSIVVLDCYPSFLLVGTYDQYHNLNGQVRGDMAYVWENAFDFSIGWVGVMLFFAVALVWMIVKLRREARAA